MATEQTVSPLWKVGWGFTGSCNMACPFCYSRSARVQEQEIPLEAAKRFIRRNASEISCINYGTGESTLSSTWYNLIASIRADYPDIRQALTTNGTLAVGRHATRHRTIWTRAIDEVDVSIDFANPQRHNEIRGNPHAFDWAIRTLELCAEESIVATIVFVGFSDTLSLENLGQLVKLAKEYNAFLRMNILRPAPMVTLDPPTPKELYRALTWLLQNARVVSLCDPLFGSVFDPLYHEAESTGITSLRILPDGSITPSTYLITEEWKGVTLCNGDVSLREIEQSEAFRRIRQAPLPADCAGCARVETCRGGAIDRRMLHFNTLEERDPYCPYRANVSNIDLTNTDPIHRYPAERVPSVHDGYLPTLIFAP